MGCTVQTDSQGVSTNPPSLHKTLGKVDRPSVALLWDAHHTFVSGKEQPEDTVRQLGRYIRHTHLKDSVPAGPPGQERCQRLTREGEGPVWRPNAGLPPPG